ncbi:MAG: DUF3572 domain-containing protein [Rhodospirillales bacterium]|nr:DUF3572 domain-containing protein [Rhodospirillales bacterium]
MPIRDPRPQQQSAETVAIQALGWIAADEDRLGRFMGLAGLSVDELRARAAEPEFLGGVLDFVLENEALLVEFAAVADLKPDAVLRLRRQLPGAPVWE